MEEDFGGDFVVCDEGNGRSAIFKEQNEKDAQKAFQMPALFCESFA